MSARKTFGSEEPAICALAHPRQFRRGSASAFSSPRWRSDTRALSDPLGLSCASRARSFWYSCHSARSAFCECRKHRFWGTTCSRISVAPHCPARRAESRPGNGALTGPHALRLTLRRQRSVEQLRRSRLCATSCKRALSGCCGEFRTVLRGKVLEKLLRYALNFLQRSELPPNLVLHLPDVKLEERHSLHYWALQMDRVFFF